MDIVFKSRLIENHEKMNPEHKKNFLRLLKFHPERVRQIIASNLEMWGMNFAIKTGRILQINQSVDPAELLVAFQDHFAEELAAVPEEPVDPSQQSNTAGMCPHH